MVFSTGRQSGRPNYRTKSLRGQMALDAWVGAEKVPGDFPPTQGQSETRGHVLTWSGSRTTSCAPSSSASSLPSDAALSTRASSSGLRGWTWSRNCIRVSSRARGCAVGTTAQERQQESPRPDLCIPREWASRSLPRRTYWKSGIRAFQWQVLRLGHGANHH